MDRKSYACILAWRQKFSCTRTPKFLIFCTFCDHPITIGDRVVAKRRQGNKASLFHEKCYEASFIDYLTEEIE